MEKTDEPEVIYPARTIAKMLGLTVDYIGQLARSGVIQKNKQNKYTADCITQYCKWIRAKALGQNSNSLVGDANEERARLLKAQADHKEIEVDELKKNVIPYEVVQDAWMMVVSNSKAKLLGIPSKAAHRLIACDTFNEAEELLTEHIEIALSELSNDGIPDTYRASISEDVPELESTT